VRGRLTPERVKNRISRELVTRLGISPARCHYRYLQSRLPEEFEHRIIDPSTESRALLPRNINSRDELSRDAHIAGFSFHDVPFRHVAPTLIATIPDCRVLIERDQWGDRHYAIITRDERVLRLRGTAFQHPLHAPLMATPGVRVRQATWILEAWDRNYAHWLQWHLTKIALLQRHGIAQNVLLPSGGDIGGVVGASVEMLGLTSSTEVTMKVMQVDELTVITMDSYRRSLLTGLRDGLAPAVCSAVPPHRRFFISRRAATRRRLQNEDRCWQLLASRGYERVVMEDHPFRDQVALMREAAAVVALHGAGLANILWAPEGLQVMEIADVTFPNPQYYALAETLGHDYWLLRGQAVGDLRPGQHDLSIDLEEVEWVLGRVEASLVTRDSRLS
jgi:hypothetical protein